MQGSPLVTLHLNPPNARPTCLCAQSLAPCRPFANTPVCLHINPSPGHPHTFTQLLPGTELLRENKRMLDKAIRELDRERMQLQTQEKKLVVEIKKMAAQGQMVG